MDHLSVCVKDADHDPLQAILSLAHCRGQARGEDAMMHNEANP
jgi:hypothetical protein